MSEKILKEVPITRRREKQIDDMLQGFVERAARGELRSIAIVATKPDGSCLTNFVNYGDRFFLIGGIECLKDELIQAVRSS